MRIALFGPPGVGKGTQATLLTKRQGLKHISTGVLLRAAIKEGSEVGRIAERYMKAGKLVPGEIVRNLAEGAIAEQGYDNFILDGYPRTVEQAEWLTEFLDEHHAPLHAVLSLRVPTEVVIDRLSKRRVHRVTGENYHLDFKPPPPDVDPSLIIQRADDHPDVIRKRLQVNNEQTAPVEDYYRARGLFHEIDGLGEIEDVHEEIVAFLQGVTQAV